MKMRKAFAALLAVLMCLTPVLAGADDGYLGLVATLVSEDQLGEPDRVVEMNEVSEGFDLNVCTAWFFLDIESCMLVISGEDANGRIMGVFWVGRDFETIHAIAYAMTANYETMAGLCEHGFFISFHLADGTAVNITNAEQAAQYVEFMYGSD